VLDGDRIAGILTQTAILRGLRDHGAGGRVETVMAPATTAEIDATLAQLLEDLQGSDTRVILVTRAGRLVGLVDLENIGEFLRFQQALAER
jgi:CBS domain-containing protein